MFCILLQIAVFSQHLVKPNVPFALYSTVSPGESEDSILFNIHLKSDSIQLSGKFGVRTITDFQQIQDYFCKAVKYANERNFISLGMHYSIVMIIDSAVSFRRFDELLEEIIILGFSDVFLSTKNRNNRDGGFYISLSENPDNRQAIVKELYGAQYSKKKLTPDCVFFDLKKIFQENAEVSEDTGDLLELYLKAKKSKTDSNYYIIKSIDGKMMIGTQQVNAYSLAELIMKKNTWFIVEPGAENTYYEVIRLMDVLYHAQKVAMRKSAINLYNKTYDNLSEAEFENIFGNCYLSFTILSLSDQLYLERNSQ